MTASRQTPPLPREASGDPRSWHSPADVAEALRRQRRFVRPDVRSLQAVLFAAVLPGSAGAAAPVHRRVP